MKFYTGRIKRKIFLLLLMTITAGSLTAGYFFGPAAEESAAGVQEGLFLPIIMYHSVVNAGDETGMYVVSARMLEEDLKWLKKQGYETVFISEVIDYVKHGSPLPEKPVMITFDDGMLNSMQTAFSVMERYRAKGVYSVVGKYCQGEYGYMDWSDLSAFEAKELVEIQNHSYDMHELGTRRGSGRRKGEGVSEYVRKFASDTSQMQLLLKENCGIIAQCYTYPFGIISEESVPVLEALGFEASLSCYEKPNYLIQGDPDSLFLLNRYNRSGTLSTEDFMEKVMRKEALS